MLKKITELIQRLSFKNPFAIKVALIVLVFLFGRFLYSADAQFSINEQSDSLKASVSLPVVEHAKKIEVKSIATSSNVGPVSEIHIANNGLMLLRGVRITSISKDAIHLATSVGSVNLVWKAQIKLSTKFMAPDGIDQAIHDIKVGDLVTVTGDLIEGGEEPIIDTHFIREQNDSN